MSISFNPIICFRIFRIFKFSSKTFFTMFIIIRLYETIIARISFLKTIILFTIKIFFQYFSTFSNIVINSLSSLFEMRSFLRTNTISNTFKSIHLSFNISNLIHFFLIILINNTFKFI